jgi:hypothetical protein
MAEDILIGGCQTMTMTVTKDDILCRFYAAADSAGNGIKRLWYSCLTRAVIGRHGGWRVP